MRILGISEGSHDAAWCLIEDGEILEAHHQERHDRKKNSKWLDANLLPKADVVVGHQILANVNGQAKNHWKEISVLTMNITTMKHMLGLDGQHLHLMIVIY